MVTKTPPYPRRGFILEQSLISRVCIEKEGVNTMFEKWISRPGKNRKSKDFSSSSDVANDLYLTPLQKKMVLRAMEIENPPSVRNLSRNQGS
jgi:hypothetical protein